MSGKLVCICYDNVFKKEVYNDAVNTIKHRGQMAEVFITEEEIKTASVAIIRDRLGVNPLYWMNTEHGFLASSEIKAFIPFVRKYNLPWELDETGIYEYMMFRYTAGIKTLIKQVNRALPGEVLRIGYKKVERSNESAIRAIMEQEDNIGIMGIEKLLIEAVEESYTPDDTAVILSGGVDSSLLTALVARHSPVTISMVFDDFENSELKWSRQIAYSYNTNHNEIHFCSKDFADNYLKAIWHNDEPINFPNSVAIMFMSEHIKKMGFDKVMAGEGADEIFAGYGFFSGEGHFKYRTQYNLEKPVQELINVPVYDLIFRQGFRYGTLNERMWYTFQTYLQTVCNRLDKMTQAHGIKAVCPFVDRAVVEASMKLPDDMKVRGDITKWVIKKIAENYMDTEQIYRPKVGFSIPVNNWLRDSEGLGRFVSILEEDRTLSRNIYRADGIKELLYNFRNKEDSDRFTYAGRVWTLLNLELWIRTFIEAGVCL